MQPLDEKVTRRRMSLILGCLGAVPAHAQTKKAGTTIYQEIDFKTTPARIYETLLDAKQFSAFTKDAAEIQPQPGAAFKLFGGRIEGRNVELMPNQRIVQAWRPASWPSGVYSIVRFELVARGSGTRIVLDHAGFPEDQWEHLSEGWPVNYWEPLHKYVNA
jgi:activator of HSP90 ATPase